MEFETNTLLVDFPITPQISLRMAHLTKANKLDCFDAGSGKIKLTMAMLKIDENLILAVFDEELL